MSPCDTASLDRLRDEIQTCRACDLWEGASQAVMGEGARDAQVMFVGEQPGDREDIEGHPFVGRAGRVLDSGLEQAGIPRDDVYITNVVKHFRYRLRGKRRIHQKPDRSQVTACFPWLEAELRHVAPEVLVSLVTITAHPSSILRASDDDEREDAMDAFVSDLRGVAAWLRAR